MVLYYGGHHESLGIFRDYISGILAAHPGAVLCDYCDLYHRQGARGFTAHVLAEVERCKLDLIYILPGSGDMTLSLELLEALYAKACVVLNFFDSELFFDGIDRHYAQAADLVLIPNPAVGPFYSSIGVHTCCTFSLFDPGRYPGKHLDRTLDVSFVGNLAKAGRRRYIETLRQMDIGVAVCGFGTPAGIVSHDQMVDWFNRTKINLNFSDAEESRMLLHAGDRVEPVRQLKGRITEIAMTGGFVLTEYAPGLEEMFDIGREVAVFHDTEELVGKIRHYLVHEDERRAVAAAGCVRAHLDYDCRTAFGQVALKLPDRPQGREIRYDETFVRNQANFLFYYFFRFLLQLQLSRAFWEIRHILTRTRVDFRQAAWLGVRALSASLRKYRLPASWYDALKAAVIFRLKDKGRLKAEGGVRE